MKFVKYKPGKMKYRWNTDKGDVPFFKLIEYNNCIIYIYI